MKLLQLLRFKKPKKRFKVSVIVLCYNGQRFIEQRLNSIVNQTYKPYELIFLDDGSNDDSVKIAEKILKKSNINHKILINETNKGISHQVVKAINETKGEYIWFAEQDDYCNENLLAELKNSFDDENVLMAYCKSEAVSESLLPIKSYYNESLISSQKNSYCVDGDVAVINSLCIQNTIPSISGTIFKKTALNDIHIEFQEYKIFFDWIMYVYVLRKGKVSYCNEKLNYHRRHKDSVIEKNRKSVAYYEDIINVKLYILRNYDLPKKLFNPFLLQVEQEFYENGCYELESRNILDHKTLGPKYIMLLRKLNKMIH